MVCFKPYYKWITFNTVRAELRRMGAQSFKPYYKWITFNTRIKYGFIDIMFRVLNLIINGLPSIRNWTRQHSN